MGTLNENLACLGRSVTDPNGQVGTIESVVWGGAHYRVTVRYPNGARMDWTTVELVDNQMWDILGG